MKSINNNISITTLKRLIRYKKYSIQITKITIQTNKKKIMYLIMFLTIKKIITIQQFKI